MSDMLASVWARLSKVDCSKSIEKKNGFSYLPWATAWALLMEHYPGSTYECGPVNMIGATAEVWMTLRVSDGERHTSHTMWLPVMDARNRPIEAPTATDINKARMRCLVKCIAMFGLGHHVYAGEDLPDDDAVQDRPHSSPKPQTSITHEAARLGIEWDKPDGGLRALIFSATGIECSSVADAGKKLGSDARQKVLARLYRIGRVREEAAESAPGGLEP